MLQLCYTDSDKKFPVMILRLDENDTAISLTDCKRSNHGAKLSVCSNFMGNITQTQTQDESGIGRSP